MGVNRIQIGCRREGCAILALYDKQKKSTCPRCAHGGEFAQVPRATSGDAVGKLSAGSAPQMYILYFKITGRASRRGQKKIDTAGIAIGYLAPHLIIALKLRDMPC